MNQPVDKKLDPGAVAIMAHPGWSGTYADAYRQLLQENQMWKRKANVSQAPSAASVATEPSVDLTP